MVLQWLLFIFDYALSGLLLTHFHLSLAHVYAECLDLADHVFVGGKILA